MDSKLFLLKCKEIVRNYIKNHTENVNVENVNVYVVWSCKILQNNKALLSSDIPDGMYYELTYNGDKNEIYLDAYKKFENKRIKN